MQHYEYRMIPAGEWRRCKEQVGGESQAETPEARPHIIPITEMAKKIAICEAGGMLCLFQGFCPGEYRENGEWKVGYRFRLLAQQSALEDLILDMNEAMDDYIRQARD